MAKSGRKTVEEAKGFVKAYEEAAEADKAAAIGKATQALLDLDQAAKAAGQAAMEDRENAERRDAAQQAGDRLSVSAMILVPVVRAGLAADPENASGLKLKSVEALIATGNADDAVLTAAESLDGKNEKGLLEQVLLANFGRTRADDLEALKAVLVKVEAFEKLGAEKDKNLCTQIYANAAWCFHKFVMDHAKAAHFATKLKTMGADSNPRLKQLIDMILAEAGKAAPGEPGTAGETGGK